MQITEIKVFPVREEKLKAFVSIVLDECFMVNDIKVIKGKEGFFISMPSRRKRNGKFKDVAHPLNNETRRVMEEKILAAYEDALSEASDGQVESAPRRRSRKPRSEPRPEPRSEPRAEPRTEPLAPVASPEPRPAPPSDEADAARASEAEAAPAAKEPAPVEEDSGDRSLEEVAEHHLRDSFWGT